MWAYCFQAYHFEGMRIANGITCSCTAQDITQPSHATKALLQAGKNSAD